MNQITFIKELDELGLSVCNGGEGLYIMQGTKSLICWRNSELKDLTYQNRIDIIRECKRNLK